jgi:hypothetical protein
VIVFNNGAAAYNLDVPMQGLFPDGASLRDLWGGGEARVTAGRIAGLALPPRSGAVLAAEENLGQRNVS